MKKKLVKSNIFELYFGYSYPVIYAYKKKFHQKTYQLQKPLQNVTTHI